MCTRVRRNRPRLFYVHGERVYENGRMFRKTNWKRSTLRCKETRAQNIYFFLFFDPRENDEKPATSLVAVIAALRV